MKFDKNWTRWVLQTAKTWEDMRFVIKETGIAHIDHEHKRMTDYMVEINRLLFELEDNFCVELLEVQRNIMKSFYNYTAKHCSGEEKFIEKYNIPGLELQQVEHQRLLSVMSDIIYQFETGRVTSAFRHRIKLLSLVVEHINTVDIKVFNFENISSNIIQISNWSEINTFIRNIHIPLLDKQHKILTEKIMNLISLISSGNSDITQALSVLDDLRDSALNHFKTETSIIKTYHIPELDIQNKQHDLFINFLNSKYAELKNNRPESLIELKERLLLWWINHINIFDYHTFRKSDWLKPVLINAKTPDDVNWLIAKMGITKVDNDHKHFIDILFRNLDIFEHSDTVSKSKRISGLTELYDYAVEHFHREEKIMVEKKVLDREQHILEHKSILKSLKRFVVLNSKDKVDLSSAFKRKILALWITHINDTDTGTFGVSYE